MSEYVRLTIDGAEIRAPKGTTVLDAALDFGICIPALCHMRGYTPIGACRLCVVEVVRNGRSKVTASCTLEVQESLVVLAHSEKILRTRKNIAELLVAEAPNSKAVQDVALRCGVSEVRYPFRREDCILCGRCQRVCSESWQGDTLGFLGRGKNRKIGMPFNVRPDSCKMCLTCIDVCPMTVTPCTGPWPEGEEQLCGLCRTQLSMAEEQPDTCVWCNLADGFQCQHKTM